MKVTNLSGLPEALVRAVQNDPYSKGDSEFSVTELISPPRIAALRVKHADEIEEDVEDLLYRLYGQIAHLILERAGGENAITEKRYFGVVAGAKVSAQVDTLDLTKGILSDWKFTTSYKFKQDTPPDDEWVMQLNFQLELLRQNGLDATALQIVGLLRDHSKLEAKRDENYPRKSVRRTPIEMWDREKTVRIFSDRVNLHRQARLSLPLCSEDERWARPTRWAVRKLGAVKALKLHDSLGEAQKHADKDKHLKVEIRPGEQVRCENYCAVAQFCQQFKEMKDADERTP